MAVTFFTVPFNQAELGDETITRVDWLIETNAPDGRVEYPDENYTFHGGAVLRFPGGAGELRFPTKVGSLPGEFELKLTPLIYTTGGVHGPEPRAPYYCPAPEATTPVPLSSLAATSSVPASWMSAATAQLQAYVDEAEAARDSALSARRVVNPAALGPWWAACAKRTTQPARAVFLGSSTTAGYNATAPENRWVNRLITQLQGVYPSGSGETAVMLLSAGSAAPPTAPGIQGFNAGIAATTSATYCQAATLYGIGVLNPTLVVHMIGSNDSVPGTFFVPVEQYKANVLAAIDSMASHRAHLLVHTYRRFGTSVTKAQWAAYGAALREIAEERANVAFLDISGDYEQAYGTTDPLDLIDTDMVHQTDAGHAFMAETIALYLGLAGQTGEGKVDKVETRTAPAASRRINLSYVINALQANLSEVSIGGIIRSWRNEWGAFRGRNPYSDYADAVVRGIVEAGDYTGTGNGGGNWIEVVNRLLPEGRLGQMWGVRWATGKMVRNGVEVPDLWMRGAASSALEAELPPGSVLVTLDGEKSGPRSTLASWNGGALPTVSGTVTVDAAVGIPTAPALKIDNDASAAYARFDFAAQAQVAARAYIRTPASWSASAATILALRPTSSTIAVGVALTGTASPGRVRLTTTGGTIVAESPAILSVSTDYRLEVRYNSAAKIAVLAVYALGQDVPAWSSGPIAHTSLTSTITRVDVGRVNNSPTVPEWWVDNIDVLDGSGAPVGRHATDALSSTPLPTPPYVGPVGYWDGTTLLPLLNHRTPASDVDYAGGPVLPSSSVEAALDALDGRHRSGVGRPEGVVTAPPGTTYSDTAATTGAVRWVKASGTGNTGWRVVEGDTDWRDITSNFSSALDPANTGTVAVRRTAAGVTVRFSAVLLLAGTGSLVVTATALPSGFRNGGQFVTTSLCRSTSANLWSSIVLWSGSFAWFGETNTGTGAATTVRPTVAVSGTVFLPHHTLTEPAWPTTLPGTTI